MPLEPLDFFAFASPSDHLLLALRCGQARTCSHMSARRDEAVLRKCYYCAATLLKKGNYSTAAKAWHRVDTGDALARVNEQWLHKYGAVHEDTHPRGARHKCPECRRKIAAFWPLDLGGAAAVAPPVALSGVAVVSGTCRYCICACWIYTVACICP